MRTAGQSQAAVRRERGARRRDVQVPVCRSWAAEEYFADCHPEGGALSWPMYRIRMES